MRPVRRVASFFCLLVLCSFTSCGGKDDPAVSLIHDQAATISAMAETLDDLCEGKSSAETVNRLTDLGEKLKQLKIDLANLQSAGDAGQSLGQVDELSSAMTLLQKATERAGREGKLSPEISQALSSHLNSDPMPGEGS